MIYLHVFFEYVCVLFCWWAL